MKLTLKVLLFHVFIPILDKIATGLTIYYYYNRQDYWWAVGTAACLALPGTLEFLSSTFGMLFSLGKGNGKEACSDWLYWGFLFGPILFPFSIIFWHLYHICKGENNFLRYEQRARSKVLNSLNNMSRSSFQLALQISILIITWKSSIAYFSWIAYIVVVSLVMLATSATTHHYFEVTGKRDLASTRQMSGRFVMYLLHISSRAVVISVLASYMHYYIFAFLAGMVVLNFLLAKLILKTHFSKNVFTSFAAVVLPVCFISKDHVPAEGCAEKKFSRFYIWNTTLFVFMFSVIGLVVTNVLLHFSLLTYTCDNLPAFSCSDTGEQCGKINQCLQGNPPHQNFYMFGNLLVIGASLVHWLALYVQEANCCRRR